MPQSAAAVPSEVGNEVIQRMDKLEYMMTQLLGEQKLLETNAAVSQIPPRRRAMQCKND